MNELISVIIPVYNMEVYLEECVQSVVMQTYKHLEIILIDDGSTDCSGEMCDEWTGKDERVRVVHQQNRGLSVARTVGLDICMGEWIVFVDSDDVLPGDAIQSLSDLVIAQKAEIGQGVWIAMGNKAQAADEDFTKVFSGVEFLKSELYGTSACAKIYHKTIWSGRRFREGIIHEDYDIMYRILYETERVGYTSRTVYFVRDRSDSITRSGFSEKKLILIDIDEEKIAYFRERQEDSLLEQAYVMYYSDLLHLYKLSGNKEFVRKYRKNMKHFMRLRCIGPQTKAKLVVCYFFPGIW